MSSLEDDLRRFGAESLVEKLTSRGVSINDILTGNYTPDQLARVIGQEVDRESYGEDILNGVILVLQNQGSRVHHLHSNEENREILGQDTKYHSVRDMLPLLDISSIDSSSGMDIMKAQKLLGGSVKNVLLSDKRVTKVWLLPWQAWWWTSFLPLESFLMKLKTVSYWWFVTLKVKPSELGVWNEEKIFQNLEYVKDYYNKYFFNYKS